MIIDLYRWNTHLETDSLHKNIYIYSEIGYNMKCTLGLSERDNMMIHKSSKTFINIQKVVMKKLGNLWCSYFDR